MPIEIRELVIRTEVVNRPAAGREPVDMEALKKEVVRECMQRIRGTRQQSNER